MIRIRANVTLSTICSRSKISQCARKHRVVEQCRRVLSIVPKIFSNIFLNTVLYFIYVVTENHIISDIHITCQVSSLATCHLCDFFFIALKKKRIVSTNHTKSSRSSKSMAKLLDSFRVCSNAGSISNDSINHIQWPSVLLII